MNQTEKTSARLASLQQMLEQRLGDEYDEQEYLAAWGVEQYYQMLSNLHAKQAASAVNWHTEPLAKTDEMLVYYSGIYLYNKVYRTCGLNDKKATQLAEETVRNFEVDMRSK